MNLKEIKTKKNCEYIFYSIYFEYSEYFNLYVHYNILISLSSKVMILAIMSNY